MKKLNLKYVNFIKKIVENISANNFDYKYIVYLDEMKAENIKQVVNDYEEAANAKISTPPEYAFFEPMDIVEWDENGTLTTAVSFYLWFNNKQRDLCAEIVVEDNGKKIIAYLNDILVS